MREQEEEKEKEKREGAPTFNDVYSEASVSNLP